MDDISSMKELLETSLSARFTNKDKRKVVQSRNGFNFACPFCGDSDSDSTKKRGNIFLGTNTYKCYNCGYFCSQKNFFYKMKSLDFVDYIPSQFLKESKYEKITENVKLDNIAFLNFDLHKSIDVYGIDKQYFKDYLNIDDADTYDYIVNYLNKRNIKKRDKFLWDNNRHKLYILNIDDNTQKIISFQIRQFGKTNRKYLNYTTRGMYEVFHRDIPDDEQFAKIDIISIYFNILNVSLNEPLIYTEGAMDSMFFNNAMSIGSVTNKPPFELDNCKYILDFDKPGLKKAIELIKNKSSVFLWTKFLKDYNIPYKDPLGCDFKLDVNDIIIYTNKNNIKIKSWDNYFSNNPLDLLYI